MSTKGKSGTPAYIGEYQNQKRHGFGIYRYPNSFFKYEGEWRDGKKHGHGKLIMGDSSYYEGQFQDGEINGTGLRKWNQSGNVYNGQFAYGEMTGKGVMKYGNGTEYNGEWEGNKHQGKGILSFEDGSIYEGEFYKHKRHGQGKQYYRNDEHYDGEWVAGQRQGHGVMKFSNGSIYSGQWQFNMFNGHGTLISEHGASYEGQWINNTPEFEAKKLYICTSHQPIEIEQGKTFNITVQCHTEDDELSPENGRRLQLTAGIRIGSQSKLQKLTQQSSNTSNHVLPDKPFGFNIVPYPVTIFSPSKAEIVASPTDKQENTAEKDRDRELSSGTPEDTALSLPSTADGGESDICQCDNSEQEESLDNDQQNNQEGELEQQQQHTNTFLAPNSITINGEAHFEDISLPAAPSLRHHLSPEGKDGRQTATRNKRGSAQSDAKLKRDKKEQKSTKEEKMCRTGDYVIIVEDVTDPPFLGVRLQTAYIHVKIVSTMKKTKSKTDNK